MWVAAVYNLCDDAKVENVSRPLQHVLFKRQGVEHAIPGSTWPPARSNMLQAKLRRTDWGIVVGTPTNWTDPTRMAADVCSISLAPRELVNGLQQASWGRSAGVAGGLRVRGHIDVVLDETNATKLQTGVD